MVSLVVVASLLLCALLGFLFYIFLSMIEEGPVPLWFEYGVAGFGFLSTLAAWGFLFRGVHDVVQEIWKTAQLDFGPGTPVPALAMVFSGFLAFCAWRTLTSDYRERENRNKETRRG